MGAATAMVAVVKLLLTYAPEDSALTEADVDLIRSGMGCLAPVDERGRVPLEEMKKKKSMVPRLHWYKHPAAAAPTAWIAQVQAVSCGNHHHSSSNNNCKLRKLATGSIQPWISQNTICFTHHQP